MPIPWEFGETLSPQVTFHPASLVGYHDLR